MRDLQATTAQLLFRYCHSFSLVFILYSMFGKHCPTHFFFFFGNARRELGTDKALGKTIVCAPPEVCLEHKGHILCRVRCLRKTQLEQVLRRGQQHVREGLQQVRVPALVSAPHTQRTPDSCTVPSHPVAFTGLPSRPGSPHAPPTR